MNTQTCEEAKKVGGAQKLLQFLEKLRPMFETLALRRGTASVPLHHVAEEMGAEG